MSAGQPMGASRFAVLQVVRRLAADGWPVAVREVCAELGMASPSTAHAHLRGLERSGHLQRSPRDPRSGWRPEKP